jgi:hypothetical protein
VGTTTADVAGTATVAAPLVTGEFVVAAAAVAAVGAELLPPHATTTIALNATATIRISLRNMFIVFLWFIEFGE